MYLLDEIECISSVLHFLFQYCLSIEDSTCADCSLADLSKNYPLPLKRLYVLIIIRFECIIWQVIFQFMHVVQFRKQK